MNADEQPSRFAASRLLQSPRLAAFVQNLALGLLLLPFLGALIVDEQVGTAPVVRAWLAGSSPLWNPPALLALALYAAVLWAILRHGGLGLAALLLLLTSCIQTTIPLAGAIPKSATQLRLSPQVVHLFETPSRGLGADYAGHLYRPSRLRASCNGVDLGAAPGELPLSEFKARVKPVAAPPRQTHWQPYFPSSLQGRAATFGGMRFAAIPFNPYEPVGLGSSFNIAPAKLAAYLDAQPYWWTFSGRGYTALSSTGDTSGYGDKSRRRVTFQPLLWLPPLERHADALVAVLRTAGGHPSPEWIRHVLEYEDILAPELFWRAQLDPALRPALDAAARVKYGMTGDLARLDYAPVLERLLQTVEREGLFTAPSLESAALDQFPPLAAKIVGRAWLREIEKLHGLPVRPYFPDVDHVGDKVWLKYQAWEPYNGLRLAPLDYALARLRPAGAFNVLVYQAALVPANFHDDRLMRIVGQYPRPEAVALVRQYLNALAQDSSNVFRQNYIKEFALAVPNPALEQDYRDLIVKTNDASDSNGWTIRDFARSRFGLPEIDQGKLADWIGGVPGLPRGDRLALLSQIESPRAAEQLKDLLSNDSAALNDFFFHHPESSNPALASFYIELFENYRGRNRPGLNPSEVSEFRDTASNALARLFATDSPEAHDYINRLWESGPEGKRWVLSATHQADLAPPAWIGAWVEKIRALTDPKLRQDACNALLWLATRPAYDLLREWAQPAGDPALAQSARTILKVWDEGTVKKVPPPDAPGRQAELQRQGAALIAGKLKPDDLLPTSSTWVWRDGQYIAE